MSQIKKRRIELGLTQRALAERLQVCESIVQKWEGGSRFPHRERLKKLAKVLQCKPGELL